MNMSAFVQEIVSYNSPQLPQFSRSKSYFFPYHFHYLFCHALTKPHEVVYSMFLPASLECPVSVSARFYKPSFFVISQQKVKLLLK